METQQRKLVIAPFGSDTEGEDVLLFEHGLLFGLEMALESSRSTMADGASPFSFADIHDQLGGGDKRERPTSSLTESEVRTLASRAGCNGFVDGMLLCQRDPETGELAEIAVCLRVFIPGENWFVTPDALVFRAFAPAYRALSARPGAEAARESGLTVDFEMYVDLQASVCREVFAAIGATEFTGRDARATSSPEFGPSDLQITPSWDAYTLFLKGKRMTAIPEAKLGYYEQAIKKDPEFFLAIYNAAMLYKTQTDYNTARMRLMRAAAVTEDSHLLGDVYFELGLTSIYLGDPKTARNFWEKAVEFGVDNPTLLVNMAGTYEQEENWNEAKRLNQIALDRFPSYHKAMVNLARLHAMFGQLDLAIPLYERALELQPDDALRHAVLGGCYLAAGRNADARAQFERAVELDPDADPGRYAAQELEKLGPTSNDDVKPDDDETRKRKRWGLW